jgi:hypothetical protein
MSSKNLICKEVEALHRVRFKGIQAVMIAVLPSTFAQGGRKSVNGGKRKFKWIKEEFVSMIAGYSCRAISGRR